LNAISSDRSYRLKRLDNGDNIYLTPSGLILLPARFNSNLNRFTRFDIGDRISLAIESLMRFIDKLIDRVDIFTRFLSGNSKYFILSSSRILLQLKSNIKV